MLRFAVVITLLCPAFAQKKPITLESLNETPRGGQAAAANWAPDGKTFVSRQGRKIILYDCATKASRDLISTEAMDSAAVSAPEDASAEWQNRRERSASLQWSPSGKELLYASGADIFLIHIATGKWDQLTQTPA